MNKIFSRTIFVVIALASVVACSDSSSSSPSVTVDATGPESGQEGQSVDLFVTASTSNSSSGDISFFWQQVGGPAALIDNADSATATIQIPLVPDATDLRFQVVATDQEGESNEDTLTITAQPAPLSQIVEVETLHDNARRIYSVYTPASVTGTAALVVFLHGAAGNMRSFIEEGQTPRRWLELAEQDGFVVLVPNGFSNTDGDGLGDVQTWNELIDIPFFSDADDVGFILRAIEEVVEGRTIDEDMIFVGGRSNGGQMSMRLAIEVPRVFRAVASFVGSLPAGADPVPFSLPTPPILIYNSSEDPLVRFEATPVTRGALATVDYFSDTTWSETGSMPDYVMLEDTVPDDGCEMFSKLYTGVAAEPTVSYYEGRGGGHYIPSPDRVLTPQDIAQRGPVVCRDVHGVDLAWEFFKSVD